MTYQDDVPRVVANAVGQLLAVSVDADVQHDWFSWFHDGEIGDPQAGYAVHDHYPRRTTSLSLNHPCTDSGNRRQYATSTEVIQGHGGRGVIFGRTANGRVEWKITEGKTLKQRQAMVTAESDQ